MNQEKKYSAEEIDYLKEMMNISSCNTAMALSQLLNCEVDVSIPNIFVLPITKLSSLFDDPSKPVLCIKMGMVGDIKGTLFFVIPDDQKKNMLNMLMKTLPPSINKTIPLDVSVFEEIGNIAAGTFLTAIHDFTKLNIYHTVPTLAIDMIQSLLDNFIISIISNDKSALVIENEFTIKEGNIKTILFMFPIIESIRIIFDSIKDARKIMGIE